MIFGLECPDLVKCLTLDPLCPNEQEVMKKLEDAANNTKSWKDKVAHHEGLIRLIQPGITTHCNPY